MLDNNLLLWKGARMRAAGSLTTSPQVLEQLVSRFSDELELVLFVAGNPNTPIQVLEKLAVVGSPSIKMCVAGNPNTPIQVLEKLDATNISCVCFAIRNRKM